MVLPASPRGVPAVIQLGFLLGVVGVVLYATLIRGWRV
jgi:hypothetical protein